MMEGARLGPYQIDRRLGAGGMGTVYRAVVTTPTGPLRAGEVVAVKAIHPHLLDRPDTLERFLREARVGKKVNHGNVVRTLHVERVPFEDSSHLVLALEYVEGRTLRQLLGDLETIPDVLLREIATQVSAGVAAFHAAGILHRDLKPENVLITHDQVIKIMDLGLARLIDSSTVLTKEGHFAGSLYYAAPECFLAERVDAESDLYSVGVCLYELATGENPFRDSNPANVMNAHIRLIPPPAREDNANLSPFMSELIGALLRKQPEERLGSAAELHEILVAGERSRWWRHRRADGAGDGIPTIALRRDTALYGRTDETRAIRQAWEGARRGKGGTVILSGEAGIGKTRLVDAFLDALSDNDVHVLYGSYEAHSGAGALSEAILGKFGTADLESSLEPHLAATPRLVPAFAAMVRREPPPDGTPPLEGDAQDAVVCNLMRSLANEKPLVWVMEDLHRADPESRKTLLAMARALTAHRILLIASTRPELPGDELEALARVRNLQCVSLSRLSPPAVTDLVNEILRSEVLAHHLGPLLAERSAGVPFIVLEMIQGLRDDGSLAQQPDGTWIESRSIGELSVPSAVRDILAAQLRDLGTDERAILDVAAVQGLVFDPAIVARVLDRPRVAILQSLATMERRSRVVSGEEGRCRFDHPQVRAILYEDLPPDLRAEYHTLVGDALANECGVSPTEPPVGDFAAQLASHYVRGSRPGKCLPYLEPAMSHLERSFRNSAARDLADRALGVPGLIEAHLRADLLLRKWRTLNRLGRRTEERETLEEAIRMADETGDLTGGARARMSMGWHLRGVSRYDAAGEWLRDAYDLARKAGDREIEIVAALRLGAVLSRLGRDESALEQYLRALSFAKQTGDRRAEARATGRLGVFFQGFGRFGEAEEYYDRARAIAESTGDSDMECAVTGDLGAVMEMTGRYARALKCYGEQLERSRRIGDRQKENLALLGLGRLASALGDRSTGRDRLREARRLAEEIGDRDLMAATLIEQGAARERAGEFDRAIRDYEEAFRTRATIPFAPSTAVSLLSVGRILAGQGRPEAAAERLENALAIGYELNEHAVVVLARIYLVLVHRGEVEAAETAFAALEPRLDHATKLEARYALFLATGEERHLREAHVLLEHLRDHAPEANRRSMMQNVRRHRDVQAAWEEAVGVTG